MARKMKAKPEQVYKEYLGIVDTLGLDSFGPVGEVKPFHLQIRAQANPQRHACVFMVSVPEEIDVLKQISKLKDPWDMWNYVQMVSHELKCEPKNAKTIKNMKKLADSMIACTGSARGY